VSGFGPFRPIVVQRAGWYFKPVRVSLTQRRQTVLAKRIYSSPDASSAPPTREQGGANG
jgi:hypothetical protein